MKKEEFVYRFFIGLCIEIIGITLAYMLYSIMKYGFTEDIKEKLSLFIMFILAHTIFFTISYKGINVVKNMNMNQKEKLLNLQNNIISVLILILAITILFLFIRKNIMGIIISMGIIFGLTLWKIGVCLASKTLKNSVEEINEKISENK